MAKTDLSTAMKIARLQAGKTLVSQAKEMGTMPSFISAMEHGHKKISEDWMLRIQAYFTTLGVEIPKFAELVAMSNGSISLENMDSENSSLVARLAMCFTNSELSQKDKERVASLLDQLEKKANKVK